MGLLIVIIISVIFIYYDQKGISGENKSENKSNKEWERASYTAQRKIRRSIKRSIGRGHRF